MLLALLRRLFGARRAIADDDVLVASPPVASSDAEVVDDPEALWRAAREEPSPFRRDALRERAVSAMIATTGSELLRFCEQQLEGQVAGAEDVAQRTYVTFWRTLDRFEGRSTLKTYLFGIAKNLCRRYVRDEGRGARMLERHDDAIRETVHPESLVDLDEARERADRLRELEAALATLNDAEAWLLRARFVEELGYAEILPRYQARFGAHIGTVEGLRTAFFHARRRLEKKLGGQR